MAEEKTYVFGEGAGNNGILSLLGSMLSQKGVDPNVLLAMQGRNNDGFGEGGWFIWVIFLFFLMGWGGNRFGNNGAGGLGKEEYLAQNGWHFNKKLCDWAVSKMHKRGANGKPEEVTLTPKSELEQLFRNYGIKVDNCVGYDVMYVYHMAKSDFFESSIISEQYLLQFVKDYLDDIDGYDGKALTRFYADCIGSGTPIMWEDMI